MADENKISMQIAISSLYYKEKELKDINKSELLKGV